MKVEEHSMFDRQAKIAFIVVCITFILSGFGFRSAIDHLNVYLQKKPVDLREGFSTISRRFENWQAIGSDLPLDAAEAETLGTDVYLNRIYGRRDARSSEQIHFHLAYYTGLIDAIPHVPDRCMQAGGFEPLILPTYYDLSVDMSEWQYDDEDIHRRTGTPYPKYTYPDPIRGRPITVRMPVGEFRLRTTEFRDPRNPDASVYAGFFFIANGSVTANPYEVRALAFDRTDRYAYYCKVQFTVFGPRDMTVDDFTSSVSDLLNELLPEVMRCLPDWSEIEQKKEPEHAA